MTDLEEFEEWAYERFARNTVIDSLRKLRYLSKSTDLDSRESIMSFLRQLRRDGIPPKTINEHLKYLNRWLTFRGEDKILYSKTERRSYKVRSYDGDQVQKLLSFPVRTIEDRRNHAMILLALNSGLRRSELCNLKVIDIHPSFLSVVNGKGGKDRDVYLDEYTREEISKYVEMRNNQESPYVFTTRKGKITEAYMGNIAMDIRRLSGVDFSWHKCRHTYAKTLLRNNLDLETIRQMLGHANLSTTQVYSQLDSGEAMERIRERKPKLFKGSIRSNPYTIADGLEGNSPFRFTFGMGLLPLWRGAACSPFIR
jgi:site-specific recombinase XerD